MIPAIPWCTVAIASALKPTRRNVAVGVVLAATVIVVSHILMARNQSTVANQAKELMHWTRPNGLVYMNGWIAPKFPRALLGRRLASTEYLAPQVIADVVIRQGELFFVLFDRQDTAFWKQQYAEETALLKGLSADSRVRTTQVAAELGMQIYKVDRVTLTAQNR
jgi:hypothetical protein